jgi:S1-C subfamily serine protease
MAEALYGLGEFSSQIAGLVSEASKSVVEIRSRGRTLASGIVWRPGVIVSADEALGRHENFSIWWEGKSQEAVLVGRDPSTDIAVLRAEGTGAPFEKRPADAPVAAGEIVLAVGRREQGPTARIGVLSLAGEAWRSMRGGHIDRLLRLDITLDRRSEGSLVIDARGQGIGMAVRGPRRSVLAIPSATLERIGAHILEKGSVQPGYLGLGLHPVRIHGQDAAERTGLMVLGVSPGGPGSAAGVLQGDIIVGWNGEPLSGMRDLFRRLWPDAAGKTVELGLLRAGQALTLQCAIGTRPQA